MTYLRAVLLVAGKDLRVELRSREQLVTLLFFALLVLVVFNFAFDFTVIDFVTLGPGVLWVAFIFSGVLAIGRSFQIEREQDRIQGILLSPIDRSAFYLGKVAATVLFMAVVEILIVPVAVVMFNFRFSGRILLAILALLLNTVGFAAVGTLFAAMTTSTRRSELLLPLLLFPRPCRSRWPPSRRRATSWPGARSPPTGTGSRCPPPTMSSFSRRPSCCSITSSRTRSLSRWWYHRGR